MQPLTTADVEAIALLARLELHRDEVERLRGDLVSILANMEQLQEVDTSEVEPLYHAHASSLRLREDVVERSLAAHVAIGQAPDRADGSFRVPHIIKSSGGS